MVKISKITSSLKKPSGKINMDLRFVLMFYDTYLREPSIRQTAHAMGLRYEQLRQACSRYSELQMAMALADENRNKSTLAAYIERNLPANLKRYWDKVTKLDTWEEIDALFRNKPERLRQQLFVHAVIHTGHDYSRACAIVGINRHKMQSWKGDPEFEQMLEEIQWHKKNFFERGIISLAHERHPGAIIFANRTLNRDRGYGEHMEVSDNRGTDFSIDDLGLDLATKKKILEAMERKKAKADNVLDVEPLPAKQIEPPDDE